MADAANDQSNNTVYYWDEDTKQYYVYDNAQQGYTPWTEEATAPTVTATTTTNEAPITKLTDTSADDQTTVASRLAALEPSIAERHGIETPREGGAQQSKVMTSVAQAGSNQVGSETRNIIRHVSLTRKGSLAELIGSIADEREKRGLSMELPKESTQKMGESPAQKDEPAPTKSSNQQPSRISRIGSKTGQIVREVSLTKKGSMAELMATIADEREKRGVGSITPEMPTPPSADRVMGRTSFADKTGVHTPSRLLQLNQQMTVELEPQGSQTLDILRQMRLQNKGSFADTLSAIAEERQRRGVLVTDEQVEEERVRARTRHFTEHGRRMAVEAMQSQESRSSPSDSPDTIKRAYQEKDHRQTEIPSVFDEEDDSSSPQKISATQQQRFGMRSRTTRAGTYAATGGGTERPPIVGRRRGPLRFGGGTIAHLDQTELDALMGTTVGKKQ